jgi:hypothetical protein
MGGSDGGGLWIGRSLGKGRSTLAVEWDMPDDRLAERAAVMPDWT